jgi:hypothetical protein
MERVKDLRKDMPWPKPPPGRRPGDGPAGENRVESEEEA